MSDQNQKFNYSYSSERQKEIEQIRKKYLYEPASEEVDKMEQLRRLDASVNRKATVPALTMGIVGTLILGAGMSLTMTDLGKFLGVTSPFFWGIGIGLVGMVAVISSYPFYLSRVKKQRKKAAPQILKLTEELSQK